MRITQKSNQNWEAFVDNAKADQAMYQTPDTTSDWRLNVAMAAIPPVFLVLGYVSPQLFESISFAVWGLGAVAALVVLAAYGWTSSVSHKGKEAALSYLLGDLLVLGLILLNPV